MNYDDIAHEYDRRYALRSYAGVRETLARVGQSVNRAAGHVLELGCGTGKWLAEFAAWGFDVAGIDPAGEMLRRAADVVTGDLRRGHAEQLPWPDGSFDVVYSVNALHHFRSKPDAIREAYRVLRAGGVFVSIGLDPHANPGTWYVYDFFPGTLAHDLDRFPPATQRREWLAAAGFERIRVTTADRITSANTLDEALALGLLRRSFTSQLTVLSEAQYADGMRRLRDTAARDPAFRLVVDLELYATEAWKPI